VNKANTIKSKTRQIGVMNKELIFAFEIIIFLPVSVNT